MKKDSLKSDLPLRGERVSLTAIETSDIPNLKRFFQDLTSLYYYIPTTARPLNEQQIERLLLDWNDGRENFVFAVRSASRLIGLVNIDGLDWVNSHAEIGVALTDTDARGQGYASESLAVLIRYCFLELGLHRVWARIIEDNEASLRLFDSSGFQREGSLRQHVRRGGQYRDMVLVSLLADEWTGQTPRTGNC